ncbi:MAG: hypothetical protein MRJ67_00785 [Nitrospirales bacterium]|nr:hypothetical protein [Nitrospirales bacterium]
MKMLSNTPPPRDSRELSKHFSDTYFSLRLGLALLAFTMPFVLYLYGKFWHGLDLQPSMSAYFWAATKDQCATFPVRTIFVGFLFAIGVGLYVYKGLTGLENTLLNAAAICAALVAIYPERISVTEAASDQRVAQLFESCPAVKAWATLPSLPIHYTAAVILFVLLAIVAWFCANKSLEYLPADHDPDKFRRIYRGIGIAMVLFPVLGIAVAFLLGFASDKIFFIEAAGILTFGVYWVIKSHELALSRLERDPVEALQHAARRQNVEIQQ